MSSDQEDVDPRSDLLIAINPFDLACEVGSAQSNDVLRVNQVGETDASRVPSSPERHLVGLNDEIRPLELSQATNVVIVQMSQDDGFDLVWLDAKAAQTIGRGDEVGAPSALGSTSGEAGIDEDGLIAPNGQPNVVTHWHWIDRSVD
jgi:hypothetical protein